MGKTNVEEKGIFCLSWQVEDEVLSVWSHNYLQLLNLYFKMQKRLKNIEIWYFPTSEYSMKMFGGKNEFLYSRA